MAEQPLLYDYWRSSASYRVRIALNLKQIDHRRQSVDLMKSEQREPGYLKVNPQGVVPALKIDGLTLRQSLAIIEYLDETRPEPPLLPRDAEGRARVRALAHAVAMEIHPVCNLRIVNHVSELLGKSDQAKAEWMRHFITPGLDALETMLDDPATGRFCHDDHPSLADICLVPQLYNARRWDCDTARWPRLVETEARCAELEAFAAAHPDRVRPAA